LALAIELMETDPRSNMKWSGMAIPDEDGEMQVEAALVEIGRWAATDFLQDVSARLKRITRERLDVAGRLWEQENGSVPNPRFLTLTLWSWMRRMSRSTLYVWNTGVLLDSLLAELGVAKA